MRRSVNQARVRRAVDEQRRLLAHAGVGQHRVVELGEIGRQAAGAQLCLFVFFVVRWCWLGVGVGCFLGCVVVVPWCERCCCLLVLWCVGRRRRR